MRKTDPYLLQIQLKGEDLLLLGIGFVFLVGIFTFVNIASSTLVLPERSASIKKTEKNPLQTSPKDAEQTSGIKPASAYRQEFDEAWDKLGEAFEEGRRQQGAAFKAMQDKFNERFKKAQESF